MSFEIVGVTKGTSQKCLDFYDLLILSECERILPIVVSNITYNQYLCIRSHTKIHSRTFVHALSSTAVRLCSPQ